MRVPITINKNTLKTYLDDTIGGNTKSTLQSGNFSQWDREIPKTLQELCVERIAGSWEATQILDEIPLAIDRCLLLDLLSTDLPLSLTIPKINDDIYWKRCYMKRWPKSLPRNISPDLLYSGDIVRVNNTSRRPSEEANGNVKQKRRQTSAYKKWKDAYLEMHTRDYLEKLKPEEYNGEKMKELCDLCGDYVKILDIRELQCSENSPNRIPLNSILTGFKNLTELSLCFKQTYVGEAFTWDILRVSLQDVKLLSKGLEKSKLRVFKLMNSDINDEKISIILKSLLKHDSLSTLDFSHCKISDYGAICLSKFIQSSPVKDLILTNNKIGSEGAQALCYALCKESCNIESLNVKLNPLKENGANFIIKALNKGARVIKKLVISACGLGKSNQLLGEMIENNSSLEHFDLSNNALGEEIGDIISKGIKYNFIISKLDLRMCQLNPETEFSILEKVNQNRKMKKTSRFINKPIIVEPYHDFEIPVELQLQIENAFG